MSFSNERETIAASVNSALREGKGSDISDAGAGEDMLAPHIDTFAQLRDPKAREAYLMALARAMSPDEVDPELWGDWLSGKALSGKGARLKPPKTHGQGGSRDFQRQSDTVKRAAYAVTKVRQSLDRAQDRVKEAEAALVQAQNDDKATLQALLSNELRRKMAEVFAMGPAWAILRAISATPHPEEVADLEAHEREPEKLKAALKDLGDERHRDTREIMEALWCWMGDFMFEADLRRAILKTAKARRDRKPPRSRHEVRDLERLQALPGEVTADRQAVLNGLRRA